MGARDKHPSSSGNGHPMQAFCICGSSWFRASIAIQHDGSINGVAGPYTCIECGEQYPLGWVGSIRQNGDWYDPSVPDEHGHHRESTDG